MGLLGSGWDDPQSAAMMALSGGLLQGNFGAGLLGANNAYAQSKKSAMDARLSDAQLRNYDSEIEARKLKTVQDQRQQARIESFFPNMRGGAAAGQGGAGAGSQPPGGVPQPGGAPSGGGGNDILALSQQLGIPPQAIQADLVFNGGKKISELLDKHGSRDMQVTNGYAYDKNRLGAGYLPQLSVSQNGQASMIQIGPDGLPVVSAPTGAQNTYAGFRNIDESAKANFDVQTVTPQGQNPQMTTRGALVRNPAISGTQINPQQQSQLDQGRTAILQQELGKAQAQLAVAMRAGDQSAAARAQTDIAALQREMGGRSATVGMPLQSEEEKLRAQKGVEGDAERNKTLAGNVEKSSDLSRQIGRARTLLGMDPTASGVGSVVDKGAALFGMSTKSAETASALDNLSGWLTSNVPRMEGPQSNFDVENYKTMAGKVGDRGLPVAQRLKALDELELMQQKYAKYNAGGSPQSAQPAQNMLQDLPKSAPKGQRVRDTTTGKVLRFNGLSWVEEK